MERTLSLKMIMEKNEKEMEELLLESIHNGFNAQIELIEDVNQKSDNSKKEAFLKNATDIIAENIFNARKSIEQMKSIAMEKESIPTIDKVLEDQKVDANGCYKFETKEGKTYYIDADKKELAKKIIRENFCPSHFGMEDKIKESNNQCGLIYQCDDCWNKTVLKCDIEELIDEVGVIKGAIYTGLVEATEKMLPNLNEEKTEKVEMSQEYENKNMMSKLEKVVEHLKCEGGYRYFNNIIADKEELIELLYTQNCPHDFGIEDFSKDKIDTTYCDTSQCVCCWNHSVVIETSGNYEMMEDKNVPVIDIGSTGTSSSLETDKFVVKRNDAGNYEIMEKVSPLKFINKSDSSVKYFCPKCYGHISKEQMTKCLRCGQEF